MSTFHGNAGVIRNGANAVSEVRNWTLETSVEVADDTAMGDTFTSHLVNGNKSWEGSAETWYDPSDANGQEAMDEGDSITINLYPRGTGAGVAYFTGTATIMGTTVAVPRDGTITRTINFRGNGALTRTTV